MCHTKIVKFFFTLQSSEFETIFTKILRVEVNCIGNSVVPDVASFRT